MAEPALPRGVPGRGWARAPEGGGKKMTQRDQTRRLLAIAATALLLAGCQTLTSDGPQAEPAAAQARADDPQGDRALGKKHFRAQSFGLAETHFRRAVEADATDAESWLGLAASYDQL